MPASLRQEHRDATRRRIIAAARKVLVKKGYARATIEEITTAAGVSRATLYLHFDSKLALFTAASEKLHAESQAGTLQLVDALLSDDRATLRGWVEWALAWYARNRPMAQAADEVEVSEDKPSGLKTYHDRLGRWVETWPPERRTEARMRVELCRLQMHSYMWGKSHAMFAEQELPVDLFTEIWWNTLQVPRRIAQG